MVSRSFMVFLLALKSSGSSDSVDEDRTDFL